VGASERNLRESIKLAEAVSPSILWIDEIEKGLSGSQSSNFSDGGTTSRIFGYLITWMQEKTKPVYLVATANNVNQLPPELLRKGRFDEIFFVDLPTEKERKEIFNIHLNKKSNVKNEINVENFDLEKLASKDLTEGFSGAEIEQAIIDGMYKAFAKKDKLNNDYIIEVIKQTKPLSVTMKEDINAARNWAKNRARRASKAESEENNMQNSEFNVGNISLE
jgi:SpoVK/Ycf46/Vps4 family AAA+-type ATPase